MIETEFENVNYLDVRVGDRIRANPKHGTHFLVFQDGFKIDLSPVVTVIDNNGVLYAGGVSLLSFKHKNIQRIKVK